VKSLAAQTTAAVPKLALGLDAHSVRGMGWKARQLIDYAAEQKLDAVLLNGLRPFESLEPAHLRSLRETAAARGLRINVGVGSVAEGSTTFTKEHGSAETLLALGVRVATDLERIGDLAKNMGKRVAALESDFQPLKLIRGLEHMTDLVLSQVKSVLDAYAAHDLPAAMNVWKGDEEVDAICTSLFRELLTYMMEDPRNISFCIHLMFCAKNIERIGDHATNIAETVFYMIEGQQITDKRPKGDMTNFATTVPGNT
jgi:hypothetical protein